MTADPRSGDLTAPPAVVYKGSTVTDSHRGTSLSATPEQPVTEAQLQHAHTQFVHTSGNIHICVSD